jgi:hypothetical protein
MIFNFADMIKQRQAATETMSTLLAFTAAVSLIHPTPQAAGIS